MVTQAGLKVLGTQSAYSATGTTNPIVVPTKLNLVTSGKDLTSGADGLLSNLNNATITTGTFSVDVYSSAGTRLTNISVDTTDALTLQEIANAINDAIAVDPTLTKDGQ